jgi:hypothetical protein
VAKVRARRGGRAGLHGADAAGGTSIGWWGGSNSLTILRASRRAAHRLGKPWRARWWVSRRCGYNLGPEWREPLSGPESSLATPKCLAPFFYCTSSLESEDRWRQRDSMRSVRGRAVSRSFIFGFTRSSGWARAPMATSRSVRCARRKPKNEGEPTAGPSLFTLRARGG